jgi:Domain of Unknown Function (DUF1080)
MTSAFKTSTLRRSFLAFGLSLAVAGLTFAAGPHDAIAQPAGWTTLFDGKSLDKWTTLGDANWSLADGVVQADKGNGHLVSKENYKDFELKAEIWTDEKANSGIFVRCTDPTKVTASNAYEFNVFDTRPDPSYGTGAIVDIAKVTNMPKAAGKWNTMEITVKGDTLSFVFNGIKTVDAVKDSKHTAAGPITLQYGGGVVKFRKVEIKPL